MKKIAFFGGDLKFINHIIDYLNNKLGYEVRIDKWDGHDRHDEAKSREILEWADVLFCEWGLGNVIWCQENKKSYQKLIVRLHRFEMNTKYPKMFDYEKIDQLIAISPFIFEEFNRVAKVPREKMKVIFNAVDTHRFNVKKKVGSEHNLGIIGIVPKLKRLDRAVDIFERLYDKDNRYNLYIKGKHPKEFGWVWNNIEERSHYEQVFKRIEESQFKNNVHFEGWGDVSVWLQKIGYVLSVSDYESFHLAPIEGMASGAYPIVLDRAGVKTIFPNDTILKNIEDAVSYVQSKKRKNELDLKKYVQENFSLETICPQIEKIF